MCVMLGGKTLKDGDINKDITKVWRWFAESGERLGPYVPRSQRWMAEDDAKKKKKKANKPYNEANATKRIQ